jgi:hypothetical protein
MTEITKPSKIELNDDEEELLAQIDFNPSPYSGEFHETLRSSCIAAAKLTESILSRKVVPEIRRRYFTDPELNIGTKKSRKQVFEQNGTRSRAIIEHPHFLKFLQYFIFGPELPESVIEEFWRQATHFDMELRDICKFSRSVVRQYELDPLQAREEFYKLALECGLVEYEARIVRDAVRTVR